MREFLWSPEQANTLSRCYRSGLRLTAAAGTLIPGDGGSELEPRKHWEKSGKETFPRRQRVARNKNGTGVFLGPSQ